MRAAASPMSPSLRAALMMVVCSALVALSMLFAKALTRGAEGAPLHPLMATFGRYLFGLMAVAPVFLRAGVGFAGTPWALHSGRVLCGWAGVSLVFAAGALMPLADATAISFLNPMVAMALAVVFLGERSGPVRWGAAAVALLGAALLVRPSPDAIRTEALLALGAALILGVEVIFVKLLAGREPTVRVVMMSNLFGAGLAAAAALLVWTTPSPAQWAQMVVVGVAMVAAQGLFVSAIKLADASYVTPFFYLTLIFAALYDHAMFGEAPDALSAAGAALIVAGAVVLAIREGRARAAAARIERAAGSDL